MKTGWRDKLLRERHASREASSNASVAELEDAANLELASLTGLRVQIPSLAL